MSHRTSLHQLKDEDQIHFLVSWAMTICGLVGWYQHVMMCVHPSLSCICRQVFF